MTLRRALVLYLLLPMWLATGLISWWALRAFERQVEKRMQQDVEMVARAIKQPLHHALLREREGSIAQALESAFAMSHVYGAYLYDAEGRRISDSGPDRESPDRIERQEVTELAADGERHGEYGEMGGRDVYSYFVPLTDSGGRITGLLQLTRRRSDFQEQIHGLRYKAASLFTLVFTGLAGMVLFGHHRIFGKHMNRLSETMMIIAEGRRFHRYSPAGPREIVALGNHFNLMMDKIDQAEKEIEDRRNQQKALEERLRQTEKLAAIGELAAGVAHELGNPLSLIDAKTQRSLRRQDLPDSLASPLHEIRRQAQRMEQIILQLRDFSSRNRIQLCRVQAASLIRTSVAAVEDQAKAASTRLVIKKINRIELMVDPIRIEQALINLLCNAIQATPGGLVTIDCRQEAGNQVAFIIQDNGPGIDPRLRSKLFEPFFTTKPVGTGTGLGLAVVHGIAEEHLGRVELSPETGKGACFRLVVPASGP